MAAVAPSPRARPRGGALLALSVSRALAGVLAKVSIALGAVVTLGAVVVVAVMARRDARPPLDLVPSVTSSVLAWAVGITLAFAAAAHALRKDREQGAIDLVTLRGATERAFVAARVGGLAVVLVAVVGGGTLVAGAASVAAAWHVDLALRAIQATFASLVYAAAFAGVVAPIALATLGARSRAGGYMSLIAVLVAPEVFEGWIAELLPRGWGHVASVPSALAALRDSLMPPRGVDVVELLRASLVLAVVAAVAAAFVWQQAGRVAVDPALGAGRTSP